MGTSPFSLLVCSVSYMYIYHYKYTSNEKEWQGRSKRKTFSFQRLHFTKYTKTLDKWAFLVYFISNALTKTVIFFQKAKRIGDGESLVRVGNLWKSLLSCRLNEKISSRVGRFFTVKGRAYNFRINWVTGNVRLCNRWYNECIASSFYRTGLFCAYKQIYTKGKQAKTKQ